MAAGKGRQVGLGMGGRRQLDQLPLHHPMTHVLAPSNAFHRAAAALFARARDLGLQTVALAPFVRGWPLDEIGEDTAEGAAILLH